MSAMYHKQDGGRVRLLSCPSAALLFAATRSSNVHWRWDGSCYQTHGLTRDARIEDVRSWPADSPLSSVLRATREDDRMAGDPLIRWLAFYLTAEYLIATAQGAR